MIDLVLFVGLMAGASALVWHVRREGFEGLLPRGGVRPLADWRHFSVGAPPASAPRPFERPTAPTEAPTGEPVLSRPEAESAEPPAHGEERGLIPWHLLRKESYQLSLLLLVALAFRVIWLDRIPTNITADEADNLWTIFRIYETGQPGFFGLDWKPGPAFSMYIFAAFMAVFGENVFGMRMASAVLSTAALVPFYALTRRLVHPHAALAATALLATGQWYLHFSRSGWENAHTALYALLAAWALTVALEQQRLRWFAAAGGAAALGLYGYFSGRLVLFALLGAAPWAWWINRGRTVLVGFVVLAATAVVLFLPQAGIIQEQWDLFNRRTESVNVLRQPRPYLGETTDVGILRAQLERVIGGFFLMRGDVFTNGRYSPVGQPLYDPVTGVLLLVGLGIGLWKWRTTGLYWAMLVIPLAATQLFSTGTPDGARGVMIAPFLYAFVALAIGALFGLGSRRSMGLGGVVLAAAVVLVSWINLRTYFAWIESPPAAEARQPAVELAEYDVWRTLLRAEVRKGGFFNVGQWHEMRPTVIASQPAPASPQLQRQDTPITEGRGAYRLSGSMGGGNLADPRGLAVSPDGTIYVADAGARAVLRFAPDGRFMGQLGGGVLVEPVSAIVRPSGEIDVLDADAGEIVRFNTDGQVQSRFGKELGMYRPRGMGLAATGETYVADTGRSRLVVLTPDGLLARIIEANRFNQPTQVAPLPGGGILVAEPDSKRVQRLDQSDRTVATWSLRSTGTLHGPYFTLGPGETVLLTEPAIPAVLAVRFDGGSAIEIIGSGDGPAAVRFPSGVGTSSSGAVFVADRERREVLRFEPVRADGGS